MGAVGVAFVGILFHGDPATRRPGNPATRQPGDPATRRPGDPATPAPIGFVVLLVIAIVGLELTGSH